MNETSEIVSAVQEIIAKAASEASYPPTDYQRGQGNMALKILATMTKVVSEQKKALEKAAQVESIKNYLKGI